MTYTIDRTALLSVSPGTRREVVFHRFGGANEGPRVYVQGSLHANETPGLLVLHHLLRRVCAAEREGRITGHIVLVPYANPIGLSHNVLGNQVGREALDGGGNYNRGWPALGRAAAARLEGALADDGATNRLAARDALVETLDGLPKPTEIISLQHTLLREALRADYVLDVHTELVAVAGMVVSPWSFPAVSKLIDRVAPDVVHVTDTPLLFDTAATRPLLDIAAAWPDHDFGPAPCSTTLELRGCTDVSDQLAARDADAIFGYLIDVGAIADAGDAATAPVWPGTLTPHEAILMQRTPAGGVIVYHQPLGARVAKGDHVADVIDPAAIDAENARTPIHAAREGMVYAHILNHLVRPDDIVLKIAGSEEWVPEDAA